MRDSGWYHPLIFGFVMMAVVFMRDGVLGSIPSCLYGLALIVGLWAAFRIVFGKPPQHKYVRPTATYKRIGVIEVIGDVNRLQHNFNNLSSPANWIHLDYQHWRVEMPTHHQKDQTMDVVNSINGSIE